MANPGLPPPVFNPEARRPSAPLNRPKPIACNSLRATRPGAIPRPDGAAGIAVCIEPCGLRVVLGPGRRTPPRPLQARPPTPGRPAQNLTIVPILTVRGGTLSSTALKYWFVSMFRNRLVPAPGMK